MASGPIHTGEEVGESSRWWQGSDNVNVHDIKSGVWGRNGCDWGCSVSLYFCTLCLINGLTNDVIMVGVFRNKLQVCTVIPLTCRTGTCTKKTSSIKEMKGKAVTTKHTNGKEGDGGTYKFMFSVQASLYVNLCYVHVRDVHVKLCSNYWPFHADINNDLLESDQVHVYMSNENIIHMYHCTV